MTQSTFNNLTVIITIITVSFLVIGTCVRLPVIVVATGSTLSILAWAWIMIQGSKPPKS